MIGDIDNPYDREFTVTDLKDEVYKVLSMCPVFDKWVYLKDCELQGTGEYYISYDIESKHISITRISGFQPWVYDSSSKKIVSLFSRPNLSINNL